MMQKLRQHGFHGFSGFLSMLILTGCLTINVYFPAAAVQEAANQFVDEVQNTKGNQPPGEKASPSPTDNHSFLFPLISVAHAEEQDATKINTPVARQILDEMKNYQNAIAALKDKGVIGESNKGMLVDRNLKSLPLKDRSEANRLLATSNGQRMKLYLEVIRANNYPEEKLDEVQKIFAKSWRSKAQTGWWIQNEDGSWAKK